MGKRIAQRQFRADFKRRVVAQTYAAGTLVSIAAWRHDITPTFCSAAEIIRDMRFKNRVLPVEISPAGEDCKPADELPMLSELGIWIAEDVRFVFT